MYKNYPSKSAPAKELKLAPSNNVLQQILNYSKSTEVVKTKQQKLIISLN
jgi:hypothetical protein